MWWAEKWDRIENFPRTLYMHLKKHTQTTKNPMQSKKTLFFQGHSQMRLLLNVLTHISTLDVCMSHGTPEWLVLTRFKITIEIGI